MIDKKLLESTKKILEKDGYVPPPGTAGMPMDPAMGGGAAGGMGMDPMAAGGAMPPMDPAMMGGMPMDPMMGMGGAPPLEEDPLLKSIENLDSRLKNLEDKTKLILDKLDLLVSEIDYQKVGGEDKSKKVLFAMKQLLTEK